MAIDFVRVFEDIGFVGRLRMENIIRDSDVEKFFLSEYFKSLIDGTAVEIDDMMDYLSYQMTTNNISLVNYTERTYDWQSPSNTPTGIGAAIDLMGHNDDIVRIVKTSTSPEKWDVFSLQFGLMPEAFSPTVYPTYSRNEIGVTFTNPSGTGYVAGKEFNLKIEIGEDAGFFLQFFRDYLTYAEFDVGTGTIVDDDLINYTNADLDDTFVEVGKLARIVNGEGLTERNAEDYLRSDYYKDQTENTYTGIYDIVTETNRLLIAGGQSVQENTNSIGTVTSTWSALATQINDSTVPMTTTQMAANDTLRLERLSSAGKWSVNSRLNGQLPETLVEDTAYPQGQDYAGINVTIPSKVDLDSGVGELYRDVTYLFGPSGEYFSSLVITGGVPSTNMSSSGELYCYIEGGYPDYTVYFYKSQDEAIANVAGTRVAMTTIVIGTIFTDITELNDSGLTGVIKSDNERMQQVDGAFTAFMAPNIINTDGGKSGYMAYKEPSRVFTEYGLDVWQVVDIEQGSDEVIILDDAPAAHSVLGLSYVDSIYPPTTDDFYNDGHQAFFLQIKEAGDFYGLYWYDDYEKAYLDAYGEDYSNNLMFVTGVAASGATALLEGSGDDCTFNLIGGKDFTDLDVGVGDRTKLMMTVSTPNYDYITKYVVLSDPLNMVSGNLDLHNVTGVDEGVNSGPNGELYCYIENDSSNKIHVYPTLTDLVAETSSVADITYGSDRTSGYFDIDELSSSGLGGQLYLDFKGFGTTAFSENDSEHYGAYFMIVVHDEEENSVAPDDAQRTTSIVGDVVRIPTVSDDGGNYQTFYRDSYETPCESSGSPTIPDSQAE